MAERKTSGYVTALLPYRFLLLTAGLYKCNFLSITLIIELISNTIAIHPCFFKTSISSSSNTLLGFSVRRITSVEMYSYLTILRWFNSEFNNYVTVVLATISALSSRSQSSTREDHPELNSSSLPSCY